MAIFTGCGVAIATPFLPDGQVDFQAFRDLIQWQIAQGIDAIVVCGTTGESSTLDDREHIEAVQFCVDVVQGRVPVIGGAGSNDTRHGIQLAKALEQAGADGLLLVTPYYNKCSQRGLIQHYTATADSVDIPCLLYSVSSRTGVNIAPQTVAALAAHPNIVGIKEASGDIAQVAEIARLVPEDFAIYSGNDDMVIPIMALGGLGYISVVANVAPKDSIRMTRSFLEGNLREARDLQLHLKSLIDALFADVNPIPVKAALHLMGKCQLEYRLPLCPPNRQVMERIRHEMTVYGLI
ncbi:4-hydroxy-tetrahydrodipicolinate synthase [Aminipila butyrica]|uniref:4-hydroxy-tetrahydrodipicolinate synthase n=1 Tax=Aminipila butyrica TaxID=433296 RepID=A0A858BXI9_9FIRM|nr:4-hydroxy-tetrahydrodipicolinate synthase [Aminipila butyrica]QIB69889.1 4-hydroxy-tetrahydrodipicolinate synthase [Aminipila butyrica]